MIQLEGKESLEVPVKNEMKEEIKNLIKEALKNIGIKVDDVLLEHPADLKNGDYSTNVALVYAKAQKANPFRIASELKEELTKKLPEEIEKVEIAGAGFINFYLSRDFFSVKIKQILKQKESWGRNEILKGKKIMVEYTDPNPFKPFHIGHLMTNAIGESIARIMEYSGAKTVRANYQGDVGPHVAKAIWGIVHSGENYEEKSALWIGEQYTSGSNAYETDENSKKEIDEINKKIYDRSDEGINKIYDWGRKATLDAFEELYSILGTKFNHYFFESEMAPVGEKIVRANMGKVFTESEGAIIFQAEKYDPKLHTRVFITSRGIPLYETKEIGLTVTKFEKENPDLSIIVTANEQKEYMKVVQKAVSLIHPDYEARMKHITHGMMKFATGKMSSRKGNIVTGESLIRDSMEVVYEKIVDKEIFREHKDLIAKAVGVAAVKYSILKSSIASDIIYDFEKSISFEGDSGPYLQYSAVRAGSILEKAAREDLNTGFKDIPSDVSCLEKLLYQFPEIVERAQNSFEPHFVATYLTELASAFNTFYANTQVINKTDPYSPYHLALVTAFRETMQNGLYLLGIETPEKM